MYFTNLSTQLTKHLQQHIVHLTQAFAPAPDALSFFVKYSNVTLTAHSIAMINDPNARDPKWYLNIHFAPVLNPSLTLIISILHNACTSLSIWVKWEIPCASSYNHKELRASYNESHEPKNGENEEVYHVPRSLIPYYFLILTTWLSCILNCANRIHTQQSSSPTHKYHNVD
jgi:hypothetical protein